MVISQILGGLGNQMFQYAAGLAVAKGLGTSYKVDISGFSNYQLHQGFELDKVFAAEVDIASAQDARQVLGWQSNPHVNHWLRRPAMRFLRKSAMLVEPHIQYFDGIKKIHGNVCLYGYWQSEKYFSDWRKEIREQFRFRQELSAQNAKWAALMAGKPSVAVHVRRGDFFNKVNVGIHGVCTAAYFMSAIRYILERLPEAEFFFFSDDMAWVRENIVVDSPCHYVENNTGVQSFNDMRLMSLCRHNIISNSSFSWWGGWLNGHEDKMVLAPKKWFATDIDARDLIPANWVTFSVE